MPKLDEPPFFVPARPFIVWALLPLVFRTVFVSSYYQDFLACIHGF